MVKAVVYQTGNDGKQAAVCEVMVSNGVVVPVQDHPLARYILGRSVLDRRYGEVNANQGERFLEALPGAYSGTRLRVGLE